MVTEEDYRQALLRHYDMVKDKDFADYLLTPTPAKLKKLSILLLDGLGTDDKKVFEDFFNEKDITARYIEGFDPDKFKPLCNFLRRKSMLGSSISLNLIAILIDFEYRPYKKFKNYKSDSEDDAPDYININTDKLNDGEEKQEVQEEILPVHINLPTYISYKKRKGRLLIGLLLLIGCIIIYNAANSSKGCMVWVKDHYEKISCEEGFSDVTLVAFDSKTYENLKKVEVSDTTSFFHVDKTPKIWYGKSANKKYDYFTYYGLHPETQKTLKPITPYIIDHYIATKKAE